MYIFVEQSLTYLNNKFKLLAPTLLAIFNWFLNVFTPKVKQCPPDYMEYLVSETFFNPAQIEALYKRFLRFASRSLPSVPFFNSEFMIRRSEFFKLHSFTNYPLYTITFDVMFREKLKHKKDIKINFLEMVKYLSLFEANNLRINDEEILTVRRRRIYLLFRLLDLNGDRAVDRGELDKMVCQLGERPWHEQAFILNIIDLVIGSMNSLELDCIGFDKFYEFVESMQLEECRLIF